MAKYKIDDIVLACVTGITEYGFFVSFDNEYTGLCHISEVSNDFVSDISKFVNEGEDIYVQILEIDEENKHMKVSIKNIYYKTDNEDVAIVESRKGFLPLKNMLPIWIEEKMKEINEDK